MNILDTIKNLVPEPVEIKVETWGGASVFVLPPTKSVLDIHDEILSSAEGEEHGTLKAMYYLLGIYMVEEDGARVFSSAEQAEELLSEVPFDGVLQIYQCIVDRRIREASKVRGAEKNSVRRRRK